MRSYHERRLHNHCNHLDKQDTKPLRNGSICYRILSLPVQWCKDSPLNKVLKNRAQKVTRLLNIIQGRPNILASSSMIMTAQKQFRYKHSSLNLDELLKMHVSTASNLRNNICTLARRSNWLPTRVRCIIH